MQNHGNCLTKYQKIGSLISGLAVMRKIYHFKINQAWTSDRGFSSWKSASWSFMTLRADGICWSTHRIFSVNKT